jgi:bis(5'-nucleosyl)-tetraphosphatase (symmetrical)
MRRVMGALLSSLVGGARPVRHATAPAAARYFVVGDVHGCLDELHDLLKKADIDETTRLVLVGDLVNKGPKSLEVIRYCRENEICVVRGNHDDKCLRLFDGVDELKDEYSYVGDMTAEDAAWLRNLPHTLTLPHVDSIVVHAGLRPSTKLEDQSPQHMTTMRSLEGGAPSAKPGDASWASERKEAPLVIFGHDARRGLQQFPYAIGLDTGCCYGGALTGVFLPSKELVSVPARRTYSEARG